MNFGGLHMNNEVYIDYSTGFARWLEVKKKVESFKFFKDNWDGEGACGVSSDTVETALFVVNNFIDKDAEEILPNSFGPLGDGTIVFEWCYEDGRRAIYCDSGVVENIINSYHSDDLEIETVDLKNFSENANKQPSLYEDAESDQKLAA